MVKKFSFKKRLKSFTYAYNGIKLLIKEEHNALIHSVLGALAILMGYLFHISRYEWIAIFICIGMVFAAELFNTAIENLCNYISPANNSIIKKVKDTAAGAVLVVAIAAFLVGLMIFVPKIF